MVGLSTVWFLNILSPWNTQFSLLIFLHIFNLQITRRSAPKLSYYGMLKRRVFIIFVPFFNTRTRKIYLYLYNGGRKKLYVFTFTISSKDPYQKLCFLFFFFRYVNWIPAVLDWVCGCQVEEWELDLVYLHYMLLNLFQIVLLIFYMLLVFTFV